MLPNLDNLAGFEDLTGYNAILLTEGRDLLIFNQTPRIMELFNTRYVIASFRALPLQTTGVELIGSDQENGFSITMFKEAFPRAYWAPRSQRAVDDTQAMALLKTADLGQTVIITAEEPLESEGPAPAAGESADQGLRPARIIKYDYDEVLVESDAAAPGWLVLSDRLYPGWTAEVDDQPARIYKANLLVRAVRLEAGKHTVRFRFRPDSLRYGAYISVPAWLFALGWWATAGVQNRRKRNRNRAA